MEEEKAKHLAKMFKAYLLGERVQIKIINKWVNVSKVSDFCAFNNEFRIYAEPKLVPFTFEDNLLFRDKWIRQKDLKALSRLSWFGPISISLGDNNKMTYIQLLDNFEFEDGSPCGKYVEE